MVRARFAVGSLGQPVLHKGFGAGLGGAVLAVQADLHSQLIEEAGEMAGSLKGVVSVAIRSVVVSG